MTPLLANTALDPATSDMNAAAAHLREILRIRKSSPLFRLTTEADINARTSHYNTGNTQDALIVMRLSDGLDPTWIPTTRTSWSSSTPTRWRRASPSAARTASPCTRSRPTAWTPTRWCRRRDLQRCHRHLHHPGAHHGRLCLGAGADPPLPPSTLDWVGKMYAARRRRQPDRPGRGRPAASTCYVRVYEAGCDRRRRGAGRRHRLLPALGAIRRDLERPR